jgi:hypothetical protein
MNKRLVCLTFAMLLPSAFGQSAPFKMGLWENKMTTSNGAADKDPAVLTSRSCVTPESWQAMFGSLAQKRGCTNSVNRTSSGYQFAASCTTPNGATMKSDGTITIQSPEHVTMESHTVMNITGKTRVVDTHAEGRFLSTNCGKIKPGDPEVD